METFEGLILQMMTNVMGVPICWCYGRDSLLMKLGIDFTLILLELHFTKPNLLWSIWYGLFIGSTNFSHHT